MKKINTFLVLFLLSLSLNAQEVIRKKGYTLTFESNDPGLNPALKQRMIATFFEVYPRLAKTYNRKTLRTVKFRVDTAYKGVAATSNGSVVFAAHWLKTRPEDIDVVTHEVMHIVQNYGQSVGPGWLTEGIADYVRYRFGVDNAAAKWALPEFKPTQHYKNSYRITARFLVWIENKVKKGTIAKINSSLRDHSYTPQLWATLTGKSLDELWLAYSQSPEL
ncbi:Peptidase of plants and bacteria [compost metagenome]